MSSLKELSDKIKSAMELLKIEDLKNKIGQLSQEMSVPDFWTNPENAQSISQDYQDIKKEVDKWENLSDRTKGLVDLSEADDPVLKEEIEKQKEELEKEYSEYELYLLLNGPYDKNNAIISIHAGSGGTEAQDWAEMLLRMILRFSEKMGWKTRILDESKGQEAGYKSITLE
ncbi:MAG: PCRF domain-containing protein, partial [Candidatus Magasanikbacteria bacterium]|nr:PCRF domain-containing protein [Candidatus Magasanikbacteria bacterium]